MKISEAEAERLGIDIDSSLMKRKRGRPKKAPGVIDDRQMFLKMCEAHGLPTPDAEYRFAEERGRKWRFDWLFDGWLALEIQGGMFINGRHVRGGALRDEHDKLNTAVILGYSVMFCLPEDVQSGAIFPVLKEALATGDHS